MCEVRLPRGTYVPGGRIWGPRITQYIIGPMYPESLPFYPPPGYSCMRQSYETVSGRHHKRHTHTLPKLYHDVQA